MTQWPNQRFRNFMSLISKTVLTATLLITCSLGSLRELQAQKPVRIIAGLKSAQQLLDDMEFMLVNMADKAESWENNVFPNIDIFLIGVDYENPVRFDVMLDVERGQFVQAIIPVSDLKDFHDDNLDPIGIIPNRSRSDRDFYELTGQVYEGWLRVLKDPEYHVISPKKEDIPKGMPHPKLQHEELVQEGHLLFAQLKNDDAVADREKIYAKFNSKILESIEKRPDESREGFDLRKKLAEQQSRLMGQYFAEAKLAKVGIAVNRDEKLLHGDITFSALPETQLAKSIDTLKESRDRFAKITAEDPILDIHLDIPMDEKRQEEYRTAFTMMEPVLLQKIDEDESASADQKKGRKQLITWLLDAFKKSVSSRSNGFAQITKSGDFHTIVAGIEYASQEMALQIIKDIPTAMPDWKVEIDMDESAGVKIHKISMGEDVPGALKEFYGDSGEIFLATGEDLIFIAGGSEGLSKLKAAVKTTIEDDSKEPTDTLFTMRMHARPVIKSLYDLQQEKDLGLLEMMRQRRVDQRQAQGKEIDEERKKRADKLAGFQWQPTAIEVLEGENDLVEAELKLTDAGTLTGIGDAQSGILKALGTLIAKFADENLSQ